jgi:DNA-binding MarR family transcriptional regulator
MPIQSDDHVIPTYEKALLQTVAHKHIRETVTIALKKFKLNATQWIILGILNNAKEPEKISAVAHTLQVEVPLITTLAQPLIAMGYVEQHADTNDRRNKPLTLTDDGKIFVKQIEAQLVREMETLEIGIPPHELKQYFKTLLQLIANGDQIHATRKIR